MRLRTVCLLLQLLVYLGLHVDKGAAAVSPTMRAKAVRRAVLAARGADGKTRRGQSKVRAPVISVGFG